MSSASPLVIQTFQDLQTIGITVGDRIYFDSVDYLIITITEIPLISIDAIILKGTYGTMGLAELTVNLFSDNTFIFQSNDLASIILCSGNMAKPPKMQMSLIPMYLLKNA
jgi:hypothetical protein